MMDTPPARRTAMLQQPLTGRRRAQYYFYFQFYICLTYNEKIIALEIEKTFPTRTTRPLPPRLTVDRVVFYFDSSGVLMQK